MATIYDPDSRLIKSGPIIMFFFVMASSLFGPANFSGVWWLYGCLMALFFLYVVYMIYWCESFTLFALSFLSSFVFSFAFSAAGLAHAVLVNDLSISNFRAAVINAGLLSAVLILYICIYFSPSKPHAFQIIGNKVSRTSMKSSGTSPLIISGAATLVSAIFIGSVSSLTSGVAAVMGLLFACTALMIYERHTISGLRTLRIQEKATSLSYIFMQIEEIRKARSRWLIGRLLKWLVASCTASET